MARDPFFEQPIDKRVKDMQGVTDLVGHTLAERYSRTYKKATLQQDIEGVDFYIDQVPVQCKVNRKGKPDLGCALLELGTMRKLSEHPRFITARGFVLVAGKELIWFEADLLKSRLSELGRAWWAQYGHLTPQEAIGKRVVLDTCSIICTIDTVLNTPILLAWIPGSLGKAIGQIELY